MSILNNVYPTIESTLNDTTMLKFQILLDEPEVVIDKIPKNDLQGDDCSANCTQKNGFYKGLVIALPISIALWVIIIWGIKELFF